MKGIINSLIKKNYARIANSISKTFLFIMEETQLKIYVTLLPQWLGKNNPLGTSHFFKGGSSYPGM